MFYIGELVARTILQYLPRNVDKSVLKRARKTDKCTKPRLKGRRGLTRHFSFNSGRKYSITLVPGKLDSSSLELIVTITRQAYRKNTKNSILILRTSRT
jgi:hypothetical protein